MLTEGHSVSLNSDWLIKDVFALLIWPKKCSERESVKEKSDTHPDDGGLHLQMSQQLISALDSQPFSLLNLKSVPQRGWWISLAYDYVNMSDLIFISSHNSTHSFNNSKTSVCICLCTKWVNVNRLHWANSDWLIQTKPEITCILTLKYSWAH